MMLHIIIRCLHQAIVAATDRPTIASCKQRINVGRTIITTKMNAETRLATAKVRTVALTAKHTAAPPRAVMNSVEQNSTNFTKSNRNPICIG